MGFGILHFRFYIVISFMLSEFEIEDCPRFPAKTILLLFELSGESLKVFPGFQSLPLDA